MKILEGVKFQLKFLFQILFLFVSFSLSAQTSVTVILADTDTDNLLSGSDTVTITAAFTEAMTPTPTISITGVVTNVTMTALTGAEKTVQIGETLYGSGVNDQFGNVGGGDGYGDTHLSKNGKVFAFASGYKEKDKKKELLNTLKEIEFIQNQIRQDQAKIKIKAKIENKRMLI